MQYDVAIVGAGSAGAATALACARQGLKTLCLDGRSLDRAGASWINGVPRHCFETAEIPAPEGAERRGESIPFNMIAGWGPTSIRVPSEGLLEVDMGLLVRRLQQSAIEAGAHLRGKVRAGGLTERGLETDEGEVIARVVVDASGMKGAGLLPRPPVPPERICVAAQAIYRVSDPQAAADFFTSRGYEPGEHMVFTGIAGGYSIVNVGLHGEELSILTGSIPSLGNPSGVQLLQRFVREHSWIGERLSGGSGPIPLSAPRLLARGRVALIGDAAGQVYSVHGSGVGAGMVAGAMLAKTLAEGGDPEDYATRWLRRHGGNFAGANLFARFSSTLDTEDLDALLQSGLMLPGLLAAALAQRTPRLRPADLPVLLSGLAKQRHFIRRLSPTIAKMAAAEALYATVPAHYGRQAWERQVARLMGE